MFSVVIVYNNHKTVNKLLLHSLAKQTAKFELISIDNTKGQFKSASEALNYGYTGANNIGIRYASSTFSPDYFLLLNNDVVVAPDFLTSMIEVAKDDHSIGILGPKLYYYSLPDIIYSAGIKTNIWLGDFSSIGHKQLDTGQYNIQQEVDSVAGCCLLVSKAIASS